MEQRELPYTVDGNVNWCSHYGEQCGCFIKTKKTKKLKIELSCIQQFPFWAYTQKKENIIQKDKCILVFIGTLFIMHACSVAQPCQTLCDPVDYIAHQATLSMRFSRQENWSGLPFPSPGDPRSPGIKPMSPAWQVDSLSLSHLGIQCL